ncbi:MAG: hypothetical protein IAF08_14665 [Rhizobacter sp.]|nr:hypothetical protein [Chlorobiales bacterium]
MSKEIGFFDTLFSAFNAKPKGWQVSPNWLFVAASLGVGFIDPLLAVGGAAIELSYLYAMSVSPAFQRAMQRDAREQSSQRMNENFRLEKIMAALGEDARERFETLRERCLFVLKFYEPSAPLHDRGDHSSTDAAAIELFSLHERSLNEFIWIFLQLLITGDALSNLAREMKLTPEYRQHIEREIAVITARLSQENLSPELRRSLLGGQTILEQRLRVLSEAEMKLQFIDAELVRIEQQVELLREQALVSRDASVMSESIDTVTASLGETGAWIREQQKIFNNNLGVLSSLSHDAPSILKSKAFE